MYLTETKMKVFLLFVIILVRESQSGWDLVWNEEFDGKIINTNKWEIKYSSGLIRILILFLISRYFFKIQIIY
jgi:hypothetical protein